MIIWPQLDVRAGCYAMPLRNGHGWTSKLHSVVCRRGHCIAWFCSIRGQSMSWRPSGPCPNFCASRQLSFLHIGKEWQSQFCPGAVC